MTATSLSLVLRHLASIAVISAYGSGLWALYKHFVIKGRVDPWMQLTSFLSLVGILWFSFDRIFAKPSSDAARLAQDLGCLALIAVFMGLFWWTISATRQQRLTLAFSSDQPTSLQTGGPYAWSRHPFYASYLVFWVAAALGSGDRFFWIMPFTMALLYFRAAKLEEAKFARSPLSNQYDSYKLKTAMLMTLPGMALRFRQTDIVESDAPPVAHSPP